MEKGKEYKKVTNLEELFNLIKDGGLYYSSHGHSYIARDKLKLDSSFELIDIFDLITDMKMGRYYRLVENKYEKIVKLEKVLAKFDNDNLYIKEIDGRFLKVNSLTPNGCIDEDVISLIINFEDGKYYYKVNKE